MIIQRKYGWVLKDMKSRKTYNWKIEISKHVLKTLLQSSYYNSRYALYFSRTFHMFSKASATSRYMSYCSFSNSGRSVSRHFRLSRMFCKQFASHGHLNGLRKSSF